MEPVEPVLMNVYQRNTCRKDLSELQFDDEPRVQKRQHVKDQLSCISVFVAFLTIQVASKDINPGMATVFHAWPNGRFIEIQSNLMKLHRMNQGSNFLGDSFSNRYKVKAPIQLWSESQPQHFNPLSTNPTKWSNTFKQFVDKLLTNCFECVWPFCEIGAERVKTWFFLMNRPIIFHINNLSVIRPVKQNPGWCSDWKW